MHETLRAPMAPASLALIVQLEAAVDELQRRYPGN
ncbi:dihydrodipicolinate synthase [Bordetella holmesii]|nr:dihydrodipicolinate synthase [Bordetella holmesii H558]AOB37164.1 dihydrodipicolinate synthase [Bordetella holmesii]AUL21115.1 dihydrodipicolinate synthase [Bordetella holmesii]AUL24452.1 dihydrodipicolinate synthase [Bordetella holmesii]AUL27782.1 dihydrodipicolinate synthase [Bordetella holmesii]